MKHNLMSFVVQPSKPRNRVAEDMFDRSGPYKPKKTKSAVQYKRREKHPNRFNPDL
jgi:hypothetical protein